MDYPFSGHQGFPWLWAHGTKNLLLEMGLWRLRRLGKGALGVVRFSPDNGNRVFCYSRIRRAQFESLTQGMRNQQSIERVTMMIRQLLEQPDVLVLQRMIFDPMQANPLADDFARQKGEGELSQIVFDLNLPTRCLMENQSVRRVLEERPNLRPQHCHIIDQPEERAGIQENVHFFERTETTGWKNWLATSLSQSKKPLPTGHWPLS